MQYAIAPRVLLAVLSLSAIAFGLSPTQPDPHGILIKPIPEKLVVLTFDDGGLVLRAKSMSGFAAFLPTGRRSAHRRCSYGGQASVGGDSRTYP